MSRLIWVFAGWTGHFVGFVMRWPICIQSFIPAKWYSFSNMLMNLLWELVIHKMIWISKYQDTWNNCCNYPIIWTVWFYHTVMCPKDTGGLADSAPSVWSVSTIFAKDLSVRILIVHLISVCTWCFPKLFSGKKLFKNVTLQILNFIPVS